VVRVEQGDLGRAKIYSDDPTKVAEKFLQNGAQLVHVVDLNAAVRSEPLRNRQTIDSLLEKLGYLNRFQIAGGIRKPEMAKSLVAKGAARVVIGSIAYSSPETALEILHAATSPKTVLALDYDGSGAVKTWGWKKTEKETVEQAISRFSVLGFANFLLTSIERDGAMKGPDLIGLKHLKKIAGSSKIIGSGGVATIEDVAGLTQIAVDEVIIGKSLYEEKIPLSILQYR
jgi:phosphoribosylformimino-5-aminoimidazole carboxamide ribotide isomerase